MLSREQAAVRVWCGAAYLDTLLPGWAARIDLGRLEMASCTRCVAGQLAGPRANWLPFGYVMLMLGLDEGTARACGFILNEEDEIGVPTEVSTEEWYLPLQTAWVEAIADRVLMPQLFPKAPPSPPRPAVEQDFMTREVRVPVEVV